MTVNTQHEPQEPQISAIAEERVVLRSYIPVDRSLSFPWLPPEVIVEFLEKRFDIGETRAIRQFRTWIRQQNPLCQEQR